MLWEHKPQASVSTAFSSSPKLYFMVLYSRELKLTHAKNASAFCHQALFVVACNNSERILPRSEKKEQRISEAR